VTCPTCGLAAKFHGYYRRTPLSLLGPIPVERAYYYCGHCGHGRAPFDAAVGLTPKRLTPGAERICCLAGLLSDSFEEAAEKVLPEMSGLRLSESTAQRTTEAAGERLGKLLDDGHTLGSPRPWDWHQDAKGRTCAYVSIDAICVAQQAKGGGPAEGRMPYVAMVFNPVPDRPDAAKDGPKEAAKPARPPAAARPSGVAARQQARYLAGLYELDGLGLVLRRQAAQVGMERAGLWLALTDGGNGLEEFARRNFGRPDLVVILDFWHAAEYLSDLAKALHPGDPEQSAALQEGWCHTMKHEGGAAILAVLRDLPLPKRRPAVAKAYEEAVRYLGNNVHRMDYPRYVQEGWQIGSGSVESACKTVVGQRLNLAGMRWGEEGTDEVCHLRALFKSEPGQWAAFWRRSVN
jgi:hypothetical protein